MSITDYPPVVLRAWDAAVAASLSLLEDDDTLEYLRYADYPVQFCRDKLGVRLWKDQRQVLSDLAEYDRVTWRSCNGAGKTRTLGCAIAWGLLTHPKAVVITTAPTWEQVVEQLWREIHDLHANAPARLPGVLQTTRWELGPKWFALGRSTNKPERFAGFHATPIHDLRWDLTDEEFWKMAAEEAGEDSFMMAVFDEASGVSEAIFEAAYGFMTTPGSKMLLGGNPTQVGGTFHKSHQDPRAADLSASEDVRRAVEWRRHHTSAYDVRRHAPRLMTEEFIERAKRDWGEASPMFAVRVRGDFPDQGPNSLFAFSDLERATDADEDKRGNLLVGMGVDPTTGKRIIPCEMGVDVGAQGTGETVATIRRGDFLLLLEAWREPDTTVTERKLEQLYILYQPSVIRIDIGAMGKGVFDHLAEKGLPMVPVLFGATAQDPERFFCCRDEMYWLLGERVASGRLSGLRDDLAKHQLSIIKAEMMGRTRKIRVEGKEELKKRNEPSPDRADSIVLAFQDGMMHDDVRHGAAGAPGAARGAVDAPTNRKTPAVVSRVTTRYRSGRW